MDTPVSYEAAWELREYLMFSPDSLLPADMLTDHAIPVVAAGGLRALTASAIAVRCNCTRQAIQQWGRGRPLRQVFAERFVGRWTRWLEARTRGGEQLLRLLPEGDEVVGWTRVWLALLEAAPRDADLGNVVAAAWTFERQLIAVSVPAERLDLVHALVCGLRQARCLGDPPFTAAEAEDALALALDGGDPARLLARKQPATTTDTGLLARKQPADAPSVLTLLARKQASAPTLVTCSGVDPAAPLPPEHAKPTILTPVTTSHPTYDQLSALPAYVVQPVPVAFEDVNGHLNVRHYTGIASEGLDESLVGLGIPQNWPTTAGHACFSAEHHLVYLAELRTGDRMSARVLLLGRSERAVHALVYLLDDTHRRLSFVMEEIFLHIDMKTRRTAPWPEDVAAKLDERIAEHAELDLEPSPSGCLALR